MVLYKFLGRKASKMNKPIGVSCETAVSLFRGLYGRVARDLGVDPSYISRIARGERRSKVAEKALNREFRKALKLIRNSSARTGKNRGNKKPRERVKTSDGFGL